MRSAQRGSAVVKAGQAARCIIGGGGGGGDGIRMSRSVLKQAESTFQKRLAEIEGQSAQELLENGIGYRPADLEKALGAIDKAWEEYGAHGKEIAGTAIPTALREVSAVPMDRKAVNTAGELLGPGEAWAGQRALGYISPIALVIMLVFGTMYLIDLGEADVARKSSR